MTRLAVLSAILVASLGRPAAVSAGGMVLPVRGVRALERAGALIAGADDADSLWLNPAGLAHLAGDGSHALLFDAAYVYQTVDYARIDSGGTQLGSISNQQPGQPVPTLAGALGIGDKLVIAGGLAAPYGALHRYDDTGPQRYASVSLAGSAFVMVTVGAAYKVSDTLRIGATVQDMYSKIASRIVLSGCPGQTVCAPEDPEFDALAQVEQTDYFSPSGSIGIQYDPSRAVTLGATIQAPTRISGTGTLKAQLPSSGFFAGSMVVGDKASLAFTLPATIRAGVELHPTPAWRVEAAIDVELWSMHDELTVTPDNVRIENAPAVGTYTLGPMVIPRHYNNSYAPSLGVEWHGPKVMLGAGVSYETAAAPKGYVSVLTVDAPKVLVGIGGGYEAHGWQIGAALGYVKLSDVDVSLADAMVPQLQPIRDQPAQVIVNAGSYKSQYIVAGLRFARRF